MLTTALPGVDVGTIAEAVGLDPRIGRLFLKAGPGYGGSCFHKDLQALINYSQKNLLSGEFRELNYAAIGLGPVKLQMGERPHRRLKSHNSCPRSGRK